MIPGMQALAIGIQAVYSAVVIGLYTVFFSEVGIYKRKMKILKLKT